MLTFTSISQYKPGDLFSIIYRSYSLLVEKYPEYWKQEQEKWNNFDKQAFAVPAIASVFLLLAKMETQLA